MAYFTPSSTWRVRIKQETVLQLQLQFGFRAKHSTQHALASLTELVKQALDEGNFACGIFVDFAKAFDTVDHTILPKKLEHYGVRGLANS